MSKIVLTTDDSVMSNYNNNIYLRFLSCLPRNILPLPLYRMIVPRLENSPDGSVKEPPLPLRAVEAICVNSGVPRKDVKIVQQSSIEDHVGPETKIVGVSTHDPMGYGPATSTWSTIFNGKPHNRVFFSKLIKTINRLKEQHDFKLVVGGSGYWQLELGDKLDRFGIDHLVEGEGEISIPGLFHSLLNNGSHPNRIVSDRIPNENEIPPILGPTNCSLVEVTRGCGRGCKFCAPTTSGRLRSLPLEKITREVKMLAEKGYDKIIFQSDDCLRYGSNTLMADKDSVLNLFDECFASGASELYITHASLVTIAHQQDLIEDLTKKLQAHRVKYWGCQPGLETGSYRMVEKFMKGKIYPRDPEEWGETVIEAMKVMKDNNWYPVCTLISGLPEEDLEDVKMTTELIKK
ncbi:MAG: B12-binding domain-containing radical SAM protein, partial [Methanobacteriota archaeon]